MKIENIPFTSIAWDSITAVEGIGESGSAVSKTMHLGNIRLRQVEFSENYRGDHWCEKGHIVHVLEGALITLLKDGEAVQTTAGNSFLVGDEKDTHRVQTATGAKVLIID
jgi:hypothetical protein